MAESLDVQLSADEALVELAKLCEKRALTYGFLARLYLKEVDADKLEEMRALRFPAKTGNARVDEGYRMMAHFLSNTWPNTLEDLAKDYMRTFIGAGTDGFSAAYPYESVYTSVERLMMTDARDEVLAIYRSEGLDKADSWKEGEDHLALEFEFMQTLARRSAEHLRAGQEDEAAELLHTQKNFLHDHLLRWVPMLTEDMRKFAKTELYLGLAALTDGFLETDREFLETIVDDDEEAGQPKDGEEKETAAE